MIRKEKSPKMLAGDRGFTKEELINFVTHICIRNKFTSRIRKAPVYFDNNILPVESWVLVELKEMGYVIDREQIIIMHDEQISRKRERFVLVSEPRRESLQ